MARSKVEASRVPRAAARDNAFGRDVLAAYRKAVRLYARLPWVTGVSIAIKEVKGKPLAECGPVIAIHVRRKRRMARIPPKERIPKEIEGVPTDVIEATYLPSDNGTGLGLPASFPLRPGASYARHNGTAATLGGLVRDAAGVDYLLCTAHTLREGGKFKKGDLMVHPGPADSTQPVGVARYEMVHLGMDAGIATLEPGIAAENRAVGSNQMILAPEMPVLGDILEKSGRTTGLTQGEVRGIGTFSGFHPAMRIVSLPADPGPISESGDSGATWYDALTFAAKGLHVAINPDSNPPSAIATLMPEIMKKLRVSWT